MPKHGAPACQTGIAAARAVNAALELHIDGIGVYPNKIGDSVKLAPPATIWTNADGAKKMPQIHHEGEVTVTMKFSWNEISLGRYAGVQVIIGVA